MERWSNLPRSEAVFSSDIVTTGLPCISGAAGRGRVGCKDALLLSSRRWAEPSGHMGQDRDGGGRLQLKIKMSFQADELLGRW